MRSASISPSHVPVIGSGSGFFFFLSLSLSTSFLSGSFSSGFGLSLSFSFSGSFLSSSFLGSAFFESSFFSSFVASVFGFGFAASAFSFSLYSAKSFSYFFQESTYFLPAASCFSAEAIAAEVEPDNRNLIATGSPITRASSPSLNATTGVALDPLPESNAVVIPFFRAYSIAGSSA